MNFYRFNTLYSGIPPPELYSVLSAEGIRDTEFKTGVLLHLCTPSFVNYECRRCSRERAACVYAAGGCIVHDEGDMIVAEWLEENMQLSDAISQAIQCAFKIQDLCKIQMTQHGWRRPIKIAISAGRFYRVNLGDHSHVCAVVGPAVEEIWSAEVLADDGDIIVSPEAWRLCDGQNLTVEYIDNGAVKVWYIIDQHSDSKEDLSPYIFDSLSEYPKRVYLLTNVERRNIITRYMVQTALDKLHENWHLEDLSEIWPASIIFVNLQFTQTQTDPSFDRNKVSEIITEQMSRCHGEICSVFFFEEGCIFVGVIGLPGDERQDETADALQAAYQIHETCLSNMASLWRISVGVATGRVLYKVQQNPLKKEYKVFGQTVRLAAKLTMGNPGIVSSDVATKLYSRLSLSHIMPELIISPYEEEVYYDEEIIEMLADEIAGKSREMDGKRLALAHMLTMVLDEQMVVKYAAAIGHTFSIEMLENILSYLSEQDLITTLTSLVRVGIIKCASIPQNVSSTETCDCEKNSREHTQDSLDPVWPCRLMSFCNNDEMELVCKLIQNDKYVFLTIHMQCANYLEKKAYRCRKCEAKTFIFEHKAATDDNDEHLQEIYDTIRPYEAFQSQGIPRQYQMFPTEGNGYETKNFLAKVKSITEVSERTTAGSCECAQLVEAVLIPRLRHWKCAGDVPKTYYYLLECAAAFVSLQNDAKAMEYLREARSILENLKERKPAFPLADRGYVQICELQQALMHQLTGEVLFRAGKILEVEESFRDVLKLLDCNLPRSYSELSMKLIHEKMKKFLYRFKQFEIPEKTKLGHLQECVNCLSFLWQICCMRGHLRNASLAITVEINLAMRSADPFKILYAAIDYLKYNQLKGEERECRRLEAFLCRTCASLSDHPEGRRLMSHLTRTLAIVKMCTGDLEQSVECTMRAKQLSEMLNEPGLDVRTTAASHLPLLLTNRYRESVQQILALEHLSKKISNSVAKGWFYAACMNSLLYAGFAFRPFKECLAFVEETQSDANLRADKSLMLHLYSAVAVWYARQENWEKCAVFLDKAYKVYAQIPTSIESIIGVVFLLECSVLLLRKELTECNSQRWSTLQRTRKLFSDFTQRFGTNQILTPRVLHLNAYLHQLTGSKKQARDLLREALLLCEKQGNLLDMTGIRQSQADWSGTCSDTLAEWSTAVLNMPSWDEAETLQPEQLLKYRFHLKEVEVKQHSHILRKVGIYQRL